MGQPSVTPADNHKLARNVLAINQPAPTIIGCDVGKAEIVTYNSRTGLYRTVPNRRDVLEPFVAELDRDCLIVCESTGGYEALLLQAALLAGRAAHRADARKVEAFIRSFGTLGKTDRLDARALARYGIERQAALKRWQAPDAQRDRLQALVLTRSDLVGERHAHTNRRDAPGAEPVAARLQAVIDCLTTQITAIEADIAALVDAALQPDLQALRAIPGIGKTTAPALLALMPELGTLTGRQAAALAGVAPHPNQSGKADGYRATRGGRPAVKRLLFMAALAASRSHPVLKPAYAAMLARGKKPIVAIAALMRRLIVIANAVLRDLRRTAQTTTQKPQTN